MNNEPIKITKVTLSDIDKLRDIGIQTFRETFDESNTEEDMQNYLEESFNIEKLTAEVSHQNSEFHLASSGGQVIGYLKVNFGDAQTELKENEGFEIERIYVAKDFHGQKIGQLLYEKALETARNRNARYVWLGVWEKNTKAISFYKKNGFVEFDQHIFKLGEDIQTDLMMKLELTQAGF